MKVELDKVTVSAVGMMVTNLGNEVRNLKAQRKEAEKVIEFYADELSWYDTDKDLPKPRVTNGVIPSDIKDNCGGKRAREYKTKYTKDKG